MTLDATAVWNQSGRHASVAGLARLKQGGAANHLAIEARAQWPLMSLRAPGVH